MWAAIQKRLPSDVLSLAVFGNRANPLPLAARCAESRPDAFGEKELLTRLDNNRRRQFPKV